MHRREEIGGIRRVSQTCLHMRSHAQTLEPLARGFLIRLNDNTTLPTPNDTQTREHSYRHVTDRTSYGRKPIGHASPMQPPDSNSQEDTALASATNAAASSEAFRSTVQQVSREGGEIIVRTGKHYRRHVWWKNIRIFLGGALASPILLILLTPIVNETFKIQVQNWFGLAPGISVESIQFPMQKHESFSALSDDWGKLYSIVSLNRNDYPNSFIRMLSEITYEDADFIEFLAPYVYYGTVFEPMFRFNHTIGNTRWRVDQYLPRLQDLGIVRDTQRSFRLRHPDRFLGTTLEIFVDSARKNHYVQGAELTDDGRLLLFLLGIPNSIAGACIARNYLSDKGAVAHVRVALHTFDGGPLENRDGDVIYLQNVSDFCERIPSNPRRQ